MKKYYKSNHQIQRASKLIRLASRLLVMSTILLFGVIPIKLNAQINYCSGTKIYDNAIGTITDGSGQSSPYNVNSDCKFLIKPAGAISISLSVNEFDTENNYDYVYIYDGETTNDSLIGQFSGNISGIPTAIYSTGGSMLVRFVSDHLVNGDGFEFDYEATIGPWCMGTQTLTNMQGAITDGSLAGALYDNNSSCKWLIEPANVSSIDLTFTNMDVESGYDFVRVYDGDNTSAPLLATFTGNSVLNTVSSSGGKMLLHFTSDSYVNLDGWEANYSSNVIGCSGLTSLTDATGSFDDGSSNTSQYQNNANCQWLIEPAGASSVTLDFSYIDLFGNDYIYIYDGDNINATLLASFNGYNTSSLPLPVTSGSKMLVRFVTNSSYTDYGFAASFTSSVSSNSSTCSGTTTLTSNSGTFSDGSGTDNYDSNSDCKWLIQVNGANSIELDFTSFDVENNYDFVKVYDGSTVNATLLATLSGSNIPSTITSTSGDVLVHFTSDNIVNKSGWDASYIAKSGNSNGGGNGQFCSGQLTLTAPAGSFTDGSGSSDYASNSDCEWLIAPSNAYSITLSVNQIDLESSYDFVKVYDGNSANASLLASWSGSTAPSNVTSTGGEMFVHFTSDNIVNKSGFDLSYSSTTTPNGNINNLGYCNDITTFSLPVGTFHDGSGTGTDYLDSSHCFWLIEPNQADTIELTFISYDTEANYDKIKVYDGTTVSSPLIAVLSGFGIYKKLIATSGAMLVEFDSDESNTAPGFLATWTTRSVQNGGATTAPVADFIASSTNINVGDKVDFYDLSQNIPTNHSWVFVNGSNSTSSVKNPSNIQYNMPGCYDVSLVVTNNFGTDQTTKTCYINVNALVGLGDGEAYVERDVKIYPNPADGQFNIFFHPEEDKMTNISITNMLGERIYTNTIAGKSEFDEAFDLRSYGSGVYFINISSGEKVISKKLTIK